MGTAVHAVGDPILEVESAAKWYAVKSAGTRTMALGDVDLEIAKGSFTSLLGASGCGKSTLLLLLAGLLRPSLGSVRYAGRTLDGPPAEVIYIFQQYTKSLLPWRTVLKNVALGLEARSRRQEPSDRMSRAEVRDRCMEQLYHVGLPDVAEQYPWQLSGGMQQRVALARALVCRPRVLLMDEPFSAVDAVTRGQLQDLALAVWQELGITIVFVTHDIDEAVYLSDRVVALRPVDGHVSRVSTIDIDLPRPRDQIATREMSEFLAYRRMLYPMVADVG
ncbi:MAG: ATP-binding cassette domain-containing protein [Actinobacteria bacterium]|nr:ATP-binding cassette domain-containing protein [Actinomycetota bacterium]